MLAAAPRLRLRAARLRVLRSLRSAGCAARLRVLGVLLPLLRPLCSAAARVAGRPGRGRVPLLMLLLPPSVVASSLSSAAARRAPRGLPRGLNDGSSPCYPLPHLHHDVPLTISPDHDVPVTTCYVGAPWHYQKKT